MRFHLCLTLAAATMLAASSAAHADTYSVYRLAAVQTGGTVNGTVTFDDTTAMFSGGSFTDTIDNYMFSGTPFTGVSTTSPYTFYAGYGVYNTPGQDYFVFNILEPAVLNKTGGALCVTDSGYTIYSCANDYSSFLEINTAQDPTQSGSLTYLYDYSTSATPEPSSLALLGTGLAGLMTAMRRRLR